MCRPMVAGLSQLAPWSGLALRQTARRFDLVLSRRDTRNLSEIHIPDDQRLPGPLVTNSIHPLFRPGIVPGFFCGPPADWAGPDYPKEE